MVWGPREAVGPASPVASRAPTQPGQRTGELDVGFSRRSPFLLRAARFRIGKLIQPSGRILEDLAILDQAPSHRFDDEPDNRIRLVPRLRTTAHRRVQFVKPADSLFSDLVAKLSVHHGAQILREPPPLRGMRREFVETKDTQPDG